MTNQKTLKSQVWRFFDEARGALSIGEIRSLFVAIVFLRWADFDLSEQEAIEAFEDVDHKPVGRKGLSWEDVRGSIAEGNFSTDLLAGIRHGLVDSRNPMIANAASHLTMESWRMDKLPKEAIYQIISWIDDQPLDTPADRLAFRDLFDDALSHFSNKNTGELSTPSQISSLMARLASPSIGDQVYDPCFGSAGLLTSVLDKLRHSNTGKADAAIDPVVKLIGSEVNSDAFVIGVTRLGLSWAGASQLFCGDSLREPDETLKDCDVVLANPPWGMKIDLRGREDRFPIRSKDSTTLFLQHSLSKLRHGGKCVIVVPPSFLFRSGETKQLREWLLSEHRVEAIIGLPQGAFNHTGIETCILVIQKGGHTEQIRMLRLHANTRERDSTSSMGYEEVMAAIQSPETDGIHTWDVSLAEVEDNDYDLTPTRRNRSALDSILGSLSSESESQSLKDCCEILNGKSIRSSDLLDERPVLSAKEARPQNNNPNSLLPIDKLASRLKELEHAIEELAKNPSTDSNHDELRRNEMLKDFTQIRFQLMEHEAELTKNMSPVAYVRIKDIDKNSVSHGSSWVKPLVAASLPASMFLKEGDILLSKSGTIGKAGIVRGDAVGGVAASGIFVLRVIEQTIDPSYLLAFLKCTEVKFWLEDRSRGSAAKHLPLKVIKSLPVLLPSLQVQQRTAAQYEDFDVDALTYLAELLGEDHSSVFAAKLNLWVASSLQKLQANEDDRNSNMFLETVEAIAQSDSPVRWCDDCGMPCHGVCSTCYPDAENLETLSKQSPLVSWAFRFQMSLEAVRNVSSIPDDSFLYGMLQSAGQRLLSSLDQIEGHLPNEEKARELTEKLGRRIRQFNSNLLMRTKIVVDVGDSAFANGESTVVVKVTNQGSLPLNDLEFKVDSGIEIKGTSRFPFLAMNESLELTLVLSRLDSASESLDSTTNELAFKLKWSARTIAGTTTHESREVTVDLGRAKADAVTDSAKASKPLRNSPYITGSPVKSDRNDVFVGRDQLLDDIRHQIGHSGNVVLLEGNRRAGKSSILWHLEGCDSIPGWIGIYTSFQGTEGDNKSKAKGVPTVEVFRGVAIDIAKSIQSNVGEVLLPDGSQLLRGKPGVANIVRESIKEDAPFTYFREYMELLLDWLEARGLRLLLLLDEFDKLQEGIESGITSPQVPDNLRFLLQSDSRLTAILTSMKRFRRIREEYFSALYGLGTPFDVTSLSHDDAMTLVSKPVKGQLTYSPEAVTRLVYLVAQQPYLLQCLCESVFRAAKTTGTRSITTAHVNEAAVDVLKNRHFNDLFKYAGTDRRRFILALCHREVNGPDPLRLAVLREKLSADGVDVSEEDLAADLEWLTDLELLDFSGAKRGESYALTIPLMGLWIDTLDYSGLLSKSRAESAETEEAEYE